MLFSDDAIGRSGVQRYSPGVLIGNWYEEMRQKEDRLQLYKLKKGLSRSGAEGGGPSRSSATLPAALEALMQRAAEPVDLTSGFSARIAADVELESSMQNEIAADKLYRAQTCTDPSSKAPRVPLGLPLMLIHRASGTALAIDPTPNVKSTIFEAGVSGTAQTNPMLRSTWSVFPCADDTNAAYRSEWLKEPNVLHYGQHIRIGNENLSDLGIYYLHSGLENGVGACHPQAVKVSMGACADNVFVIGRPGVRVGDPSSDGYPVRMGEPLLLYHSITLAPLVCDGSTPKATKFGPEAPVWCQLDGVRGVSERHVFFFSIGWEDDRRKIKSQLSGNDPRSTMPMSCSDGLEKVLARIRNGAIQVGGRLGLRSFALALRVAGAGGRYPQYLDRKGLVECITKLGIYVLPIELDCIMKKFDHDGNGWVSTQELMRDIRGEINPDRMKAVVTAFQRLIIEGEGGVDFQEMQRLYHENAFGHPDVEDGLITREQACKDFEVSWPSNIINTKLGTVRLEEFVEYYSDISPAFYDDRRFCAVLRNCWMIPLTDDYKTKQTSHRTLVVLHMNDEREYIALPDTMHIDVTNKASVRELLVHRGVRDVKDFAVRYEES